MGWAISCFNIPRPRILWWARHLKKRDQLDFLEENGYVVVAIDPEYSDNCFELNMMIEPCSDSDSYFKVFTIDRESGSSSSSSSDDKKSKKTRSRKSTTTPPPSTPDVSVPKFHISTPGTFRSCITNINMTPACFVSLLSLGWRHQRRIRWRWWDQHQED